MANVNNNISYFDSSTISNNDFATLNSLSDKDIVLNVSSINDLCSTWKSRVSSLDLSSDRVTSSFQVFTSYGILDNYIVSLATAINSVISAINQISNSINATKDQQLNIDNVYSAYSASNSSNYSASNGSNSNVSVGSTGNNNEYDLSVDANIAFDSLEIQDYTIMALLLSSVTSFSESNLDAMLNNDSILTEIKTRLLSFSNVSDELKELLLNMDNATFKQSLKSIVVNNKVTLINKNSIAFLYTYLTTLASVSGQDINSLVDDPLNRDILYDEINYFNTAIDYISSISDKGDDFVKAELFSIYDGNGIASKDTNVVSSVRSLIEVLSRSNNITSEKLLDNNCPFIVELAVSSKGFINNLSQCDPTSMQEILGFIF